MTKMTEEELGKIFTGGMITILMDKEMSAEEKEYVLCRIVDPKWKKGKPNRLLDMIVKSQKNAFEAKNEQRMDAIEKRRERQKQSLQAKKQKVAIAEDEQTSTTISRDSQQSLTKVGSMVGRYITPISPKGEDGNLSNPAGEGASGEVGAASDPALERIWKAHPVKSERKAAERAWKRAVKKNAAADLERLHGEWLRKFTASGRSFAPSLAKWLRGERWTDELEAAPADAPQEERRPISVEEAIA